MRIMTESIIVSGTVTPQNVAPTVLGLALSISTPPHTKKGSLGNLVLRDFSWVQIPIETTEGVRTQTYSQIARGNMANYFIKAI